MHALELKIPPPAVALIAGTLMWLAARAAPAARIDIPFSAAICCALVALGVAVALAGLVAFRRAGTTVSPTRPERAVTVVADGIYAHTRNPMYLGLLFVLTAWAVRLANPMAVLVLPAFVLYINRFQIVPEEHALHARFGSDYQAYRARVRRWL